MVRVAHKGLPLLCLLLLLPCLFALHLLDLLLELVVFGRERAL